ncbi:MAG: O-antigen ligase family protein, partial [Pseudomonadota bacterium]
FSDRELERLLPFLFCGFCLNVIAGLVQLSSPQLPDTLDVLPYIPSIGLMANENHASSLAYIMLPLLAFRYVVRDDRVWIYVGLSVAIVLYLFAVGSLAGMAISSAVAVLSLVWFKTERLTIVPRTSLFAAGLCALLLIPVLVGFDDSSATEMRPVIFATTWKAIQSYWLTGTGLGAFSHVYPSFEAPDDILPVYINRAHNDYLEIFLEVGVLGIVLIGAFFALVILNFRRNRLAQAAALSILTLAIHSLVDYPLRTMAIGVIFAYFVAVVLSVRPNRDEYAGEPIKRRRRRPESQTS